MQSFTPPEQTTPEPVALEYRRPDRPASKSDLFATAALVCGLLFIALVCLALMRSPLLNRAPMLFVTVMLVLPPAALILGIAGQPPKAAKPAPRNRRATSAIWLASIELVLIGGSLLLPSYQHDREPGTRVKCASNLRQIGLAIQMYANDNKGQLPPDLETVMLTQDLTSEVFVCPSSNDNRAVGPTTQALVADFRKPGRCSYILASPVPANWSAVTKFHVLAYELPANHNNDGSNVLFGDGHAEFLAPWQVNHVISELKAGFNPPR